MGDLHAPQILIGASNSKRFGCDMQISFAMRQMARISFSASCTCFPGLKTNVLCEKEFNPNDAQLLLTFHP
jgi:hypothetical protein